MPASSAEGGIVDKLGESEAAKRLRGVSSQRGKVAKHESLALACADSPKTC
jgi:hypothetical protein